MYYLFCTLTYIFFFTCTLSLFYSLSLSYTLSLSLILSLLYSLSIILSLSYTLSLSLILSLSYTFSISLLYSLCLILFLHNTLSLFLILFLSIFYLSQTHSLQYSYSSTIGTQTLYLIFMVGQWEKNFTFIVEKISICMAAGWSSSSSSCISKNKLNRTP